jgi:PadR family transcriptional regulator, regulatory protein PadR
MNTKELSVVGAMIEDPAAWHFSIGIGASAGIPAGTIYPVLAGLEKAGWLESRWDDGDANGIRRRLYRLTGVGQRCATVALSGRISGPAHKRRRFGFGLPRARLGFG